jgi:hypothetical protein
MGYVSSSSWFVASETRNIPHRCYLLRRAAFGQMVRAAKKRVALGLSRRTDASMLT